jgi:hypothetical protein
MEREKIQLPWWGIFEIIEAIAMALEIKCRFAVDIPRQVGGLLSNSLDNV